MTVLKQKNTLEKFITNAEMYLEPRQISIFAQKLHHLFSIGFQIFLCNGGRYLKVKSPKIYLEKPSWNTVVGLICKFTIVKFLDIFREVFFETLLKNSSWAYWERASGGVLEKKTILAEPIHGPALF